MQQGKLMEVAIRSKSRAPMEVLPFAEITESAGVQGDFRGKPGRRQVTVLALEGWQAACDELGQELDWSERRANLLVSGVSLERTTGLKLHVGDVILEISGETEPCQRMEEAAHGLLKALAPQWRGGVTCRVVSGGRVEPGMDVVLGETAEAGGVS